MQAFIAGDGISTINVISYRLVINSRASASELPTLPMVSHTLHPHGASSCGPGTLAEGASWQRNLCVHAASCLSDWVFNGWQEWEQHPPTCRNDHQLATSERILQLVWASVCLHLNTCADVADVTGHSSCVCNVIKAQLANIVAALQE